jgi:uncharacterized membrane protein YgcG
VTVAINIVVVSREGSTNLGTAFELRVLNVDTSVNNVSINIGTSRRVVSVSDGQRQVRLGKTTETVRRAVGGGGRNRDTSGGGGGASSGGGSGGGANGGGSSGGAATTTNNANNSGLLDVSDLGKGL